MECSPADAREYKNGARPHLHRKAEGECKDGAAMAQALAAAAAAAREGECKNAACLCLQSGESPNKLPHLPQMI